MVATKQTDWVAQKTLAHPATCAGVGLHSGRRVTITLCPGDVNTGIVFVRTDVPTAYARIPAHWNRVTDTRLCTVIGNEHGVTVGTIEHLLAAFSGCGIDNAVVELDGMEVPILDGSAEPWVNLIKQTGAVRQAAKRRAIRVQQPVAVRDGDKFALLLPASAPAVTVEIDFPSAAVGCQRRSIRLINGEFKHNIAAARTFGFIHEVEYLRSQGLALGGSLDNAVVIDGDHIVNSEGLRFKDEFVRHKILDCVGDLYLAGGPILGHFYGHKPGHHLNNELLRALFTRSEAWSYAAFRRSCAEPAAWTEEPLPLAALA